MMHPPGSLVAAEIEQSVRAELARLGVPGAVTVRGTALEVAHEGQVAAVDIAPLLQQWDILPAELRDRRVAEHVRALVELIPPPRARGARAPVSLPRPPLVIPLGALLLLALGAIALVRFGFPDLLERLRGAPAPPPPPPAENEAERVIRKCEATRSRVYAGGTVNLFMMDGWVAELWLLRPAERGRLSADPALATLITGGKIAPTLDAVLSTVEGGTVTVRDAPLEGGAPDAGGAMSGAIVSFSPALVLAMLEHRTRPAFLQVADRIYEATFAEVGALWARCGHRATHDLGAWFRGADAARAAAALVYAVGSFAEGPVLDRTKLARSAGAPRPPPAVEFAWIRETARKTDRAALSEWVREHGGTLRERGKGDVTVTFPIAGATSATSASRAIARHLGIGID